MAQHAEVAAVGFDEARNAAQQGRLARTIRSDQGDEAARRDVD
jgi:hypothetical protein